MRPETFGQVADGRHVQKITLRSEQLTVTILTLGAVINDVRLTGVPWPLTLGSPDVAGYEGKLSSFGSFMGPVINRIKGCTAKIDGKTYRFEKHHSGNLTQHSGSTGMHRQIWSIAAYESDYVVLTLHLPDGLGGFPGNREITLRYDIEQASLRMTATASSDAPTPFNPANHSYWSLDSKPGYSGQTLQIAADHYSEPDAELMPTGRILPVDNGPNDFRAGCSLAGDARDFYDLNLCLGSTKAPLRPIATLTGLEGVSMEMATTECGLQLYDGGTIDGRDYSTHHGAPYGPYAAPALEAQSWPGSLDQCHFPDIILRPKTPYHQVTSWTFSTKQIG